MLPGDGIVEKGVTALFKQQAALHTTVTREVYQLHSPDTNQTSCSAHQLTNHIGLSSSHFVSVSKSAVDPLVHFLTLAQVCIDQPDLFHCHLSPKFNSGTKEFSHKGIAYFAMLLRGRAFLLILLISRLTGDSDLIQSTACLIKWHSLSLA